MPVLIEAATTATDWAAWAGVASTTLLALVAAGIAIGMPIWQRKRAVDDARSLAFAAAAEAARWLCVLDPQLEGAGSFHVIRKRGSPLLQLRVADDLLKSAIVAPVESLKIVNDLAALRALTATVVHALEVIAKWEERGFAPKEDLEALRLTVPGRAWGHFSSIAKLVRPGQDITGEQIAVSWANIDP